jgi:lysophospholipase L1-like esterase
MSPLFSSKSNADWLLGKTIAFIGDSVTADSRSNFVTLLAESLSEQLDISKVVFVNSGVDSSSVADALDRIPDVLIDSDPDLFIIFLGINDSKIFHFIDKPLLTPEVFKETYINMLMRIDSHKTNRKILVTPPPLLFDEINKGNFLRNYWYWIPSDYEKYITAIKEIGKQFNASIADVYSAFKDDRSGHRLFYQDGVHPNIYGHKIIAAQILKKIIND